MDLDCIKYGGMTRKLKKLFNDRKIPPSVRPFIPIVCDEKGIVFVPGFGVRDDSVSADEKKDLYIAVCIGKVNELKNNRFHLGNEVYK